MPEEDNNLFGEFNVYVFIGLAIVMAPILMLTIAKLLFVEPSKLQALESGSGISYPQNADEQKMADCINNYIAKYSGSPYNKVNNVGKVFVSAGKQYNIHPGYIVAISRKESSLCSNPAAKGCLCYNGWGRKAGNQQPECKGYGWYVYNDWLDGISEQTRFIREEYVDKRGLDTVEKITPIYCEGDVTDYIAMMLSESEKAACYPLTSSGRPNSSGGIFPLKGYNQEVDGSCYLETNTPGNPQCGYSGGFGGGRDGNRRHAGVDLDVPRGSCPRSIISNPSSAPEHCKVYAIKDGTVVLTFGTDPSNDFYFGTGGIMIDHGDYVAHYGEIAPLVSVGQQIKSGQYIGNVIANTDGGSAMIHFELYGPGATNTLRWYGADNAKPAQLQDPTNFLKFLQRQ